MGPEAHRARTARSTPGRSRPRARAPSGSGCWYPLILNRDHFADAGYDGEVVEGIVLCVEALAAPPGGTEAVKLEEQIVITADGPQPLSSYPTGLEPASIRRSGVEMGVEVGVEVGGRAGVDVEG